MRIMLKSAVFAAALTGVAFTTVGVASAQDNRDHAASLISVDFGNVAYGYRDGYWDNGHQWHNWRNDSESQSYRSQHADGYHDWNHDRDADKGWSRH